MKRTFITSIPLQGQQDLHKTLYHPVDFVLSKNFDTRFPIIPIIENARNDREEDLEIITIRTHTVDTDVNFGTFLKELDDLGIQKNRVTELITGSTYGKKR